MQMKFLENFCSFISISIPTSLTLRISISAFFYSALSYEKRFFLPWISLFETWARLSSWNSKEGREKIMIHDYHTLNVRYDLSWNWFFSFFLPPFIHIFLFPFASIFMPVKALNCERRLNIFFRIHESLSLCQQFILWIANSYILQSCINIPARAKKINRHLCLDLTPLGLKMSFSQPLSKLSRRVSDFFIIPLTVPNFMECFWLRVSMTL